MIMTLFERLIEKDDPYFIYHNSYSESMKLDSVANFLNERRNKLNNNIKLVIFDLDDTLIREDCCARVFQETKMILDYLSSKYILAIASYNRYADWFLESNNILHYFDTVISYNSESKQGHMEQLLDKYDINKNECIFFDNDINNINDINDYGIKSLLVDEETGITSLSLFDANLL